MSDEKSTKNKKRLYPEGAPDQINPERDGGDEASQRSIDVCRNHHENGNRSQAIERRNVPGRGEHAVEMLTRGQAHLKGAGAMFPSGKRLLMQVPDFAD